MFDVACLVSDAMRAIERRDGPFLERQRSDLQRVVHPRRSDQRRSHATVSHLCRRQLHRGRHRYDRSSRPARPNTASRSSTARRHVDQPWSDATKCVLVSFDSTMRSNLSVAMPIDLICYERDSLEVTRGAGSRTGRRLLRRAHPAMERGHPQGFPRAASAAVVGAAALALAGLRNSRRPRRRRLSPPVNR